MCFLFDFRNRFWIAISSPIECCVCVLCGAFFVDIITITKRKRVERQKHLLKKSQT